MVPVALDPLFDLRVGHVLDVLRELPAGSVHCAVTSPPYYALREYNTQPVVWGGDPAHEHEWHETVLRKPPPSYDNSGLQSTGHFQGRSEEARQRFFEKMQDRQAITEVRHATCSCGAWRGHLGLEPTPELFIEHLVAIFREVRRVLRDDGVLWLNLGDTYSKQELLAIPWRTALALQADGWKLRAEVLWRKLGGMPESVFTRPGRDHEHVFMLAKQPQYFYDPDGERVPYAKDNRSKTTVKAGPNSIQHRDGERWPHGDGRLMRTVWEFPTADYPGAHFAVFPDELPERCIRLATSECGVCPACGAPWRRVVEADGESVAQRQARQSQATQELSIAPRSDGGALQQGVSVAPPGARSRKTVGWEQSCSCRDESQLSFDGSHPMFEPVPATVLDPFVGSGTTMVAARRLGRASVGIELSERYAREETTARLASWWRDPSRVRDTPVEGQMSF